MIKGLYFKLEENNEKHSAIIKFFDAQKAMGNNKVDVLYNLIFLHKRDEYFNKLDAAAKSCIHTSDNNR